MEDALVVCKTEKEARRLYEALPANVKQDFTVNTMVRQWLTHKEKTCFNLYFGTETVVRYGTCDFYLNSSNGASIRRIQPYRRFISVDEFVCEAAEETNVCCDNLEEVL